MWVTQEEKIKMYFRKEIDISVTSQVRKYTYFDRRFLVLS